MPETETKTTKVMKIVSYILLAAIIIAGVMSIKPSGDSNTKSAPSTTEPMF
jgi:PBP1b-binding outer membrane lipoprotein LpoB